MTTCTICTTAVLNNIRTHLAGHPSILPPQLTCIMYRSAQPLLLIRRKNNDQPGSEQNLSVGVCRLPFACSSTSSSIRQITTLRSYTKHPVMNTQSILLQYQNMLTHHAHLLNDTPLGQQRQLITLLGVAVSRICHSSQLQCIRRRWPLCLPPSATERAIRTRVNLPLSPYILEMQADVGI